MPKKNRGSVTCALMYPRQDGQVRNPDFDAHMCIIRIEQAAKTLGSKEILAECKKLRLYLLKK